MANAYQLMLAAQVSDGFAMCHLLQRSGSSVRALVALTQLELPIFFISDLWDLLGIVNVLSLVSFLVNISTKLLLNMDLVVSVAFFC